MHDYFSSTYRHHPHCLCGHLFDSSFSFDLNDPNIPEENIKILRRFLMAYDVSDARKTIFLQKIRPLLAEFKPVESALTERDHINEFFARLRQRYSPATYASNNRFSAQHPRHPLIPGVPL